MWQFKDKKDLLAVAFIDSETYIHTAKSIKSFILTGDVSRSIQLLHYQENRRSLSLISQVMSLWCHLYCVQVFHQDPHPMEVFSCDYLVDGNQIGYIGKWSINNLIKLLLFLVSDSDKNLLLFQYQPESKFLMRFICGCG